MLPIQLDRRALNHLIAAWPCLFNSISAVVLLFFIVPGCSTISLPQVDSTDYYVREGPSVQRFHVANVEVQNHIIPAGPRAYFLLVNELPDPQDGRRLRALVRDTPPWRVVNSLDNVGYNLLSDRRDDEAKGIIRWIVGNRPLIIAVGDSREKAPPDRSPDQFLHHTAALSGTFRLATAQDRDHKINRLYILDEWPSQIPVRAGEIDSPLGTRRVVEFKTPRTIGEIMERPDAIAG